MVSLLCALTCRFRFPCCLNLFSQSSQLNGFSPVWTLMCLFRLPCAVNLFPQTSHLNGALVSFQTSSPSSLSGPESDKASCQSPQLTSVSEESEASSSSAFGCECGFRFLSGPDPPQSSPSVSVCIGVAELQAGGSASLLSSVWL
ncbi:hypothetical protein EYF80_065381 [Liparis tanakae]|uniref:Uncharacterized protein n=1 Tax=Liparis tanakae TaxID=230148 RepID=A0A4Z2E772_9TELE|nr:hypothetical protein EYF80_065381 [Liparis tanakae]